VDLTELQALRDAIGADPTAVTDEQLTAAVAAIREQAVTAEQMPTATLAEREARNAVLRDLVAVRKTVAEQVASREAAASDLDTEAADLMAGLTEPPADEKPAAEPEAPAAEQTPAVEAVTENEDAPVADNEPELIAASGAQLADAVVKGVKAAFAAEKAAQPEVVGRKAERITPAGTSPALTAAGDNTVTATTYLGRDSDGRRVASRFDVAKAIHDTFRGDYQAGRSGRFPILHTDLRYPEARQLSGQDQSSNFAKLEATTNPTALVAAGGLCAPLEVLYDVDVIGSAARPIKAALNGFQVERGGIQFRPNTSAASAVYGAGVWTMDDDVAGTGTKACFPVECPGLQQEVVEAIYLCLEFSNITAMFDPETTASNVAQGDIAHARLAENRLLAKMMSQSKLQTGAQVIGAVRDILVNLDKVTAYYRNRHRIDSALPLTWIAPAWVKSLMRGDLARQMAAGDWAEALAPTDAMIDGWFANRGITPVWHMDGSPGTDEVQTLTVTGSPTGGTFTLTFGGQTTGTITYNASAATVEAALSALSNVKDEDITVTGSAGGPWTVTFGGGVYDGSNVGQITLGTNSLTGGSSPTVAVATTTGGGGALTVSGASIASQTYGDSAAGAAIPGFPGQIDSLLFTPGSWLFLDGGELNLGLVRDSTLNARNRYRQFMETFEGAAFRGIESLRLVMSVEPTGQTSGTKDLSAIAD
jgi:hypothetical protein